jgi:hypothetical protein
MEAVILRAVHPTWLNTQLPTEVAELIQFDPEEVRSLRPPARGIAFLARTPGVVRVLAAYRAGDVLAIETMHDRYLAPALLTEKLIFNLPEGVVDYLGLQVQRRGPSGLRATDDTLIWFLPAPEYYEYRARQRAQKPWVGPSGGGFAHVYLARALVREFPELETRERAIEAVEWKPRLDAIQRLSRRAR